MAATELRPTPNGAMAAELAQRTIIFVPFPAQGHVTPLLHLARVLADRGDISATVAVPDFIHRRMGLYTGATGVALAPIPSGVKDDGGAEPPGPACFLHAMEHHMPEQLEAMLTTTQRTAGAGHVSCLVVDLLASWAIPVAARCRVPVVGFWVGMLATYRTVAVIPELMERGFISESGTVQLSTDGKDEDQYANLDKNIADLNILPAKSNLRLKDLPWLISSSAVSQESRFAFWLQTAHRAKNISSILVNSFPGEGGDSGPFDLPQDQQILHVGPLLFDDSSKKTTAMWQADQSCMDWLDKQSPGSVIYVSFGSWAAPLEPDKITGFARGLEASGRPFLWALKDHPSWRASLPNGYTENVACRGKIVSWAPQNDVLRHEAVGCYITHCGWNSVLEAVRHGVRMVCYPISADHFVNCAYVVNMWKAGIALASSDQSDVKDCIERVMEGEEGSRLQGKVNEFRETIMVGEAMFVAKKNLDLFMEGIKNEEPDENIEIGQATKCKTSQIYGPSAQRMIMQISQRLPWKQN